MPGFAILMPPSEGKTPGGNPLAPSMFDRRASDTFNYFSSLNPERRVVIGALHQAIENGDDESLSKLFGVQGDNLQEAIEANLALLDSPRMAAMERYGPGVMYGAIDFANLPTGAQRRLLENGIIISGLYGLLRPDDLIQDYKLRIDASLPEIGKLSRYWRGLISPVLDQVLNDRFVWNLLPTAHQDAWKDGQTYRGLAEVKFFEEKDGNRKSVTHQVKTLRGALVRFIVQESADSLDLLEEAGSIRGFDFDAEASSWDEETRKGVAVMVRR
jgi:cytoplasmic iron level regulating protein YaaA (DUF328/UPF0246 family)